MNNELNETIKMVVFFNVIVGLIMATMVYFVSKGYVLVFLAGLIVAVINFVINGVVTNRIFSNPKFRSFNILSIIFRVFLIGIIGYIISTHNRMNIVAYMLGYSSQFISLILYGLSIKNEERK